MPARGVRSGYVRDMDTGQVFVSGRVCQDMPVVWMPVVCVGTGVSMHGGSCVTCDLCQDWSVKVR